MKISIDMINFVSTMIMSEASFKNNNRKLKIFKDLCKILSKSPEEIFKQYKDFSLAGSGK